MLQSLAPSLITIIFFFISLFVYTKLAGPIPFSVNSVTTTKSDAFSVTGEGKASAIPDSTTTRVGVSANGVSAEQVKSQMNTKINSVVDSIKKLGIDQKDIKTENYNVNPTYDYSSSNQKITGYSANTTISIKADKTDLADQIIDAATKAGANVLGNVEFEVTDKTKAENEAREKAINQAKEKALVAAKAAGFSLGKIINYQESSGGDYPVPMLQSREALGSADNSTKLQPGTNEIIITVTLSYEVR